MRRTQRIRPTGAAAVTGALIGAVVLAGCGAGQVTQTSTQVSGVDGANVNAGPIAVRNAQFALGSEVKNAVAYPVGGRAPLQMTIVNTGGTPDVLVSASVDSKIAADVQIDGTKDIQAGRTLNVEGVAAAVAAATPTATPPAGAPATPETAAPQAAAPTSAVVATPLPTDEPGGSAVTHVVLTGLNTDLQSGDTYDVTLTFQKAGSVTIPVPVAVSEAPRRAEPSE